MKSFKANSQRFEFAETYGTPPVFQGSRQIRIQMSKGETLLNVCLKDSTKCAGVEFQSDNFIEKVETKRNKTKFLCKFN